MARSVAVVTGASRGLGAGLCTHLVRAGFAVGACARTLPTVPTGAVSQAHPTYHGASVDVRDADAVEGFAARVTELLGPIDVWINNAGVLAPIGPLRDAPESDLANHVAVNLLGVMWGTRVFARMVHDRERPGTLINISSGAARTVYAGWAAYGATKAAVEQLTRVVTAEEADHGLAAFAVAPGVVDTGMQAMIRATPPDRFPAHDRFVRLAEDDAFNSPDWVARHLVELHHAASAGTRPEWALGSPDPIVLRIPDERPSG